jgi:two-component system response regulator FixJ
VIEAMAAERIVYILDDDAAIRRSLRRLLDSAGISSRPYARPSEFLKVAADLPAGCVLLDLHMSIMGGLEAQARLLVINAKLPVVMMTGQGNVPSAVRAMKAGAVDFIEKPFSEERLLGAVELALEDQTIQLRLEAITAAVALVRTLSTRERQVLDALVAGQPNKVIAFDLGISVRTVEVHRARMMDRLGVNQFAEAVRLGVLAQLAGGN